MEVRNTWICLLRLRQPFLCLTRSICLLLKTRIQTSFWSDLYVLEGSWNCLIEVKPTVLFASASIISLANVAVWSLLLAVPDILQFERSPRERGKIIDVTCVYLGQYYCKVFCMITHFICDDVEKGTLFCTGGLFRGNGWVTCNGWRWSVFCILVTITQYWRTCLQRILCYLVVILHRQ